MGNATLLLSHYSLLVIKMSNLLLADQGPTKLYKIHIATFPICMHQEETDLEFKFIVSNRQKSYLPLISAFISQEFSEVPPKA